MESLAQEYGCRTLPPGFMAYKPYDMKSHPIHQSFPASWSGVQTPREAAVEEMVANVKREKEPSCSRDNPHPHASTATSRHSITPSPRTHHQTHTSKSSPQSSSQNPNSSSSNSSKSTSTTSSSSSLNKPKPYPLSLEASVAPLAVPSLPSPTPIKTAMPSMSLPHTHPSLSTPVLLTSPVISGQRTPFVPLHFWSSLSPLPTLSPHYNSPTHFQFPAAYMNGHMTLSPVVTVPAYSVFDNLHSPVFV